MVWLYKMIMFFFSSTAYNMINDTFINCKNSENNDACSLLLCVINIAVIFKN